jgi:hypothetical protein
MEHGFCAEWSDLGNMVALFKDKEGYGRYGCFSNMGLSKFTVAPAFFNLLDEWVRPVSKGD